MTFILFTFSATIFFLIAFQSSTLSNNLVGKISAHFKNTPCISYFYKMYTNAVSLF
jgi:uncharacterized membrane protein